MTSTRSLTRTDCQPSGRLTACLACGSPTWTWTMCPKCYDALPPLPAPKVAPVVLPRECY